MTTLQRGLFALTMFLCLGTAQMWSQSAAATQAVVRGSVVDASGAQVAGAKVHAESVGPVRGSNQDNANQGTTTRDLEADGTGHFLLTLPGGTYLLTVQSAGFDPYVRENLKLDAGQHIDLPVKLLVAAQAEIVNVPADASASTDPTDNKDALKFKGEQLQVFSDDDTLFQQELTAVAGGDPSLPPQILVDGFSNGQVPPKASIREIRINQNPYSAQYDMPGQGRVEIFTKPGSNQFHGFFALYGNTEQFNARNPYVTTAPLPYDREHLFGDVSGPLGKKTSFDLWMNWIRDENNAPISATVLDNSLNKVAVQTIVASPSQVQNYSVRLDRQFGANDTVTARYNTTYNRTNNGGISQLGLASQATNANTWTQTFQAGDTHVIGTKMVLESRLQYTRTLANTDPVSIQPTLTVQGSFNGGSASQALHDHLDRYEFQEYLSVALKNHFIRTGARYRFTRDANLARSGFNGQFIFSDIDTYTRALKDFRTAMSLNSDGTVTLPSADRPSQFLLNTGNPSANITTGDIGLYGEDDWKARPDVTVSYGGRIESQRAVPDQLNLAPRVGAAWAPVWKKNKNPFMTLRAGFGMFYDRFDSSNLLQTIRQDGLREQGYSQNSPATFGCKEGQTASAVCTPIVLSVSSLSTSQPSIYRLSPRLHESYQMRGGLSVDHSFGEKGSGSVSWNRARQVHQFELLNINAPLPGTYVVGDPASGTRPLGTTQNIYQYSSDGLRNIDSLSFNGNFQPTRHTFFWLNYQLASRTGDTSGANSLPSNQYNVRQDYGPAVGYTGQQFYGGGGGDMPFGFNGNLFVAAKSAQRFNITTGQDLNGDTAYNDRPAFATDLTRPSVVKTAFGNFDTLPMAGQELVPFNYGGGPTLFYTEIYVSRSWHFGMPRAEAVKSANEAKVAPGKPKPKPELPYNLSFGVEIDNVLNHTEPAQPVGVLPTPQATQALTQAALTSSIFGKSIAQNGNFQFNGAANRTIHLSMRLQF